MKITFSALKDSLTPEKKASDGTLSRFLFRPLAIPVSWFFLHLSFSANMVSYLGAVVCLVALMLTLFPFPVFHIIASLLFILFAVLDCADGSMARVSPSKNPWGSFIDAMAGYIAYATLLISLGLSAFYFNQSGASVFTSFYQRLPLGSGFWIFLSALSALSNILMRLLYHAFREARQDLGPRAKQTKAPGKRLSEEIGVTGYLPILYLLSLIGGFTSIIVILYTIVYGGGCLAVIARMIREVESSK